MKRIMLGALALVMIVGAALAFSPVSPVQAHDSGHAGGCKGFGNGLVASALAGPEFGQFQRVSAHGEPGEVSEMVDAFGHSFCN